MQEMFNTQLPGGERPDIQLCIFPHLKEFLVLDIRESNTQVLLLNSSEIFVEDFFATVETEFSQILREENDHPFAHMIDLPMMVDELVRNTAMTAILNRLGIHIHHEDEFPTVIVFIVSGGALTSQSDIVLDGLRNLLKEHSGDETVAQWEGTVSRLVAEEGEALQRQNQQELTATLGGQSPDYFTLWENRN